MISEADWKHFKKVKVATLDRYCRMTLDDAVERINNDALSNHEKYISLYKLINSRDKKMSEVFDYNSRAKVMLQLRLFKFQGLLSSEQITGFSGEVQEHLNRGD